MQFKVFIDLVIEVYEPLYHALQIWLACGNFGGRYYYYYYYCSFLYFEALLIKQLLHTRLGDYLLCHIQRAL